jgi:uncharacterized protein (DUF2141 family)
MAKVLLAVMMSSLGEGVPPPGGVAVTVEVAGLASSRGAVECVLWSGALGFPTETAKALVKVRTSSLEKATAICTFDAVVPGTFAVSISHDENENGRVDKNFLGIPTERYGFSNNPSPFMRAPRFDEAAFTVGAGPVRLRVMAK